MTNVAGDCRGFNRGCRIASRCHRIGRNPADPSGFAGLRRRQPRAFAAPFEVWILA
jgi:hypothetical protein